MARTTFQISQTVLSPSDLADRASEAKAKLADWNKDGVVTLEEAVNNLGPLGTLQPSSVDAYYAALGGKQHEIKVVVSSPDDLIYDVGLAARGNFTIGPNYGNVKAGRYQAYNYETNKMEDCYRIAVELDGFDRKFVAQDIRSANLMIGPKNFKPDSGSDIGEETPIPMNIATREATSTRVQNRFGGTNWITVPEKKFLGVTAHLPQLLELAGNTEGLSFYVRLDLTDGSTQYVNLNGESGKNFEIAKNELQPNGIP